MDAWFPGNPKYLEEKHFPGIQRVRLIDYVRYLTTMSGLRFEIEKDGVRISEPEK